MSQPAVTQHVQGLERYLRTPVVTRSGRGVVLTEAGRVLSRHAERILRSVEQAEVEIGAIADLESGTVRLACFPSAAAMILPQALGALRREHPGLSFTLTETDPTSALTLLRQGECDVAIVYGYRSPGARTEHAVELLRSEEAVTLLDETVHLALPRDHEASAAGWVALESLADERWIAGCPECRRNLEESCHAAGFTPDIAFETDDYSALLGLTAEGLGVALVPDLMASAARAWEGLVLRPLIPTSSRVISAVTTAALLDVPAVERTVAALRGAAHRLTPVAGA